MKKESVRDIAKSRLNYILSIDRAVLQEGRESVYVGGVSIIFGEPIAVLPSEEIVLSYNPKEEKYGILIKTPRS